MGEPRMNKKKIKTPTRTCLLLRILLLGAVCAWATPLTAQSPSQATPERGKAIYDKHCAFCHGADGRADTPVGRNLQPRPRNFTDPVAMARLTDDQIYRAIKNGKPGTAMAAWGQVLSEPQVGDVMEYIRSLTPSKAAGLTPEQLSLEIGRRIYNKECSGCHGLEGRADTDLAKVLHPHPQNFADPIEMARLDDGRMYAAIKLGRPGTAMASWGELLSPTEIIDLMRYIRSLQQPLPAGMTRAKLDVLAGAQIYREYCVACHGEKGDAQTPLGQSLPMHDLAKTRLTDKEMTRIIAHGTQGTAMAPWDGILNSEDVRQVILFIRRTIQQQQ